MNRLNVICDAATIVLSIWSRAGLLSTTAVGQHRERCPPSRKLLRRTLLGLLGSGNQILERQGVEEKLLVLLAVRLDPFGSGLRPGELPAFFALDPFVYADLFLNEIG